MEAIFPAWTEISLINVELKTYWFQWDRLELKDGILYRKCRDINLNTEVLQVVLPFSLRPEVFQRLHTTPSPGHLGVHRTLHRIRQRLY